MRLGIARLGALGAVLLGACGGRTGAATSTQTAPATDSGPPLDAASDASALAYDGPSGCGFYDAGASTCGDAASDPLNCGGCGHDCGGGACIDGICGPAPTPVACGQKPAAIAADNEGVYWLNMLPQPLGETGHTQIMRCAPGGCAGQPTVLWDAPYFVVALSVASGTLYFPVAGGGAAQTYGDEPAVLGCATTGCIGGATILATSPSDISIVTASPSIVLWYVAQVWSCDPAGCAGSPTRQATPDGEISGLAVNTHAFAFLDSPFAIDACPIAGCGDAGPISITTEIGNEPAALAMDDANVYWTTSASRTGGGKIGPVTSRTDGAVYACAVAGCPTGPTALATYPTWLGSNAIVSDGVNVYWAFEDISGNFGTVVRCAVGGCGGQPTALGTTAGGTPAPGLVVDATRVYWSDPGRGAVMSAPK